MKRNIIILLIAACVGITIYISSTKKPLETEVKSAIEAALLEQPEFPARPVWWEDDGVMAIGMVKKQDNHNVDAEKACKIAARFGVTKLKVEIYDVLLIQQSDDWELIGSAACNKQ
ncbi:MAG: hypothetical protein ACPGF7_09860 [Pontibacterium sp.]